MPSAVRQRNIPNCLVWRHCPSQLDCAYARVPVDWWGTLRGGHVTDSGGGNCSTLLHVHGEGRKVRGSGRGKGGAICVVHVSYTPAGWRRTGERRTQKSCEAALRCCVTKTTLSKHKAIFVSMDVTKFKYLGTTAINQTCLYKEVESC